MWAAVSIVLGLAGGGLVAAGLARPRFSVSTETVDRRVVPSGAGAAVADPSVHQERIQAIHRALNGLRHVVQTYGYRELRPQSAEFLGNADLWAGAFAEEFGEHQPWPRLSESSSAAFTRATREAYQRARNASGFVPALPIMPDGEPSDQWIAELSPYLWTYTSTLQGSPSRARSYAARAVRQAGLR